MEQEIGSVLVEAARSGRLQLGVAIDGGEDPDAKRSARRAASRT
jgi:hypothetical protein